MKIQNTNRPTGIRSAQLCGIMLLAFVCTSVLANAGDRVRVGPINGTDGVSSVVEGRTEGSSSRATSGFAHLQGHAEYSRTRGLTVAGHRVNFTRSTSVFPSVDGMSSGLRSRELSGRDLTIFGAIGPNGVDAVLVIVQPSLTDIDHRWSSAASAEPDRSFIPSSSDPRVGSAPSGSPE